MTQVRILTSVRRIKPSLSYRIVSPVQAAAVRPDGSIDPDSVTIKVNKTSGTTLSELTTYQDCRDEGLFLHYKTNAENYWRSSISMEFAIVEGLHIRLVKSPNTIADELTIPLVYDGSDGVPGPAGQKGALPYPYGIWDVSVRYTATALTAPFVYYEPGNMYYVMNIVGSCIGINPASDYAANGSNATWIPFENFKAVYAEIFMARFAKLASAVFYDEYMFSQQGLDANGNATSNYSGFGTSSFTPNILLDFSSGMAELKKLVAEGVMTGEINALTGRIGDLIIRGNQLIGVIDGVEKVGLTVDEIPPLASMYQTVNIANSSINYQSVIEYDVRNRDYDDTNRVYEHSFILPVASFISFDYQATIDVLTGTFNGTLQTSVSVIINGVNHGTYVPTRTYPAGNCILKFYMMAVGDYQTATFTATLSLQCQGIQYRIAPSKTLQGPNGIISMFSSTDYFYTREGWGTEIRNGNGGLRVINGVAQVMRNGAWSNL